MAQSTFTVNGSSGYYEVGSGSDGVHISLSGDFGSGSVAVEQRVNGVAVPLLDNGSAVTLTGADDALYNLKFGDVFRLTLTGSTTPDLDWSINGSVFHRNDL